MTLSTASVRNLLTGGILAAASILAVGCSSQSSTSASQPTGQASTPQTSAATSTMPTSTSTSTPTSAASGTPTSTPTRAASGTASATHASATGGKAACLTRNLRISLAGGGAGAGTDFTVIRFANSGSAACTLYGYPGVSLLNSSDMQIGAAATRNPSRPLALVTLAPGAVANAVLGIANAENYPVADCKPTAASQMRVFPPNQTQAVQVRFTVTACALTSAHQVSVTAVTAGSGLSVG